ncbi:MAG TPA: hypothetical protein VII95_16460 [Terriglobales bacterium]
MMSLLKFPLVHEKMFSIMAVVISVVYGIRGVAIQMHNITNENIHLKKDGLVEWNKWQRLLVHYFQDFIYNLVGSLAGWIALYMLSYRLFIYTGAVPAPPQGCLLDQPNFHLLEWSGLGLAVIALLGITAKLPQTVEGFIRSIGRAVETITGRVARG